MKTNNKMKIVYILLVILIISLIGVGVLVFIGISREKEAQRIEEENSAAISDAVEKMCDLKDDFSMTFSISGSAERTKNEKVKHIDYCQEGVIDFQDECVRISKGKFTSEVNVTDKEPATDEYSFVSYMDKKNVWLTKNEGDCTQVDKYFLTGEDFAAFFSDMERDIKRATYKTSKEDEDVFVIKGTLDEGASVYQTYEKLAGLVGEAVSASSAQKVSYTVEISKSTRQIKKITFDMKKASSAVWLGVDSEENDDVESEGTFVIEYVNLDDADSFDMPEIRTWQQIYTDFITEYQQKHAGSGCQGTLAYLNNDDIPELFICCDTYHAAGTEVYTVINGQLVPVGEQDQQFGGYGTVVVYERTGVMSWSDNHMDTETHIYWKMKKDASVKEIGWFVMQSEWNGYELLPVGYAVNDKKVTKEKWYEKKSNLEEKYIDGAEGRIVPDGTDLQNLLNQIESDY